MAGIDAGLKRKPEEKALSLSIEVRESALMLHGSAKAEELTFSFRKKDLLIPYTVHVPLKDGKFSVTSPQSLPEGSYKISITDEMGNAYESSSSMYIPSKKVGGA